MKKNILFVCIENSNRSQMAQAFANIYGSDIVNAYSAGSMPSEIVNPKAIESMAKLGYDLGAHHSKSLDDISDMEFEYVITMGCGDACPWVIAKHREDWNIPDPRNMEPIDFDNVRDLIAEKVNDLVKKIE
jgi:arsenate reductase (thioredoxin)